MIRKSRKVVWEKAPDIQRKLRSLTKSLDLVWVDISRVYAFRSVGTHTRAYARIWGLPRIFQLALEIRPAYVIEVISEKFDRLDDKKQSEVLIHELVHIPRTFSGSLAPHTRPRRGRVGFEDRVHELFGKLRRNMQ